MHIAVTLDVSAHIIKVYKDGVSQAVTMSDVDASSIGTTARYFALGWQNTASTQATFDGKMDEVGLYSTLLSEATIQSDYNSGDGTERSSSEIGVVGAWRFEDDLLDETANDNDLTWNYSSGSTSPVYSTDVPFSGGSPVTRRRIITIN